jgi:hypothetical protein
MDVDTRTDIVVTAIILSVFGVAFLGLPEGLVNLVTELGISFIISGVFYGILVSLGLDFLEDIEVVGFVSAMTVAVFLFKNAVMTT